jgi:hypothetical protein
MTCKECGHKVKRLPHRLAEIIQNWSSPLPVPRNLGCGTGSLEYDNDISAFNDSESAHIGINYFVGTLYFYGTGITSQNTFRTHLFDMMLHWTLGRHRGFDKLSWIFIFWEINMFLLSNSRDSDPGSGSALDPDPYWIRIQSDQWIRSQEGKNHEKWPTKV